MASYPLGTHTIIVEGEILVSRIRGTFTAADTRGYFVLVDQVVAEHGRYFMLVDMSQGDAVPAETRRLAAEHAKINPPRGLAVWGSSLAVRTVFALVIRAIGLLRGTANPMVFVKTEEEARAWVFVLGARSL